MHLTIQAAEPKSQINIPHSRKNARKMQKDNQRMNAQPAKAIMTYGG
jgi:hypothetical protein